MHPDQQARIRRYTYEPPYAGAIVAAVLAAIAVGLTLPMYYESFSLPAEASRLLTNVGNLWLMARLAGVSSLIGAFVAYRSGTRRNSTIGRRVASAAIALSLLGGVLWIWAGVNLDRVGALGP